MRLVAAFTILVAGLSTTAGTTPQPVFKAESELVVLHVSVRDRGGRYVTGLGRDAFTVIDDGKPQTIEMFSADEVPASIAFLIDNSNSMRPNRERVIASAVEFVGHAHPQDEVVVLTFNEQVRHAFGPALAGQVDPGRFASAMSQAIAARGMTAIYDGILAGLDRLQNGGHSRQVLIVVSDGEDNASAAKLEDTIREVQLSDATIYAVALTDPLIKSGDVRFLRKLARETGGETFTPRRVEQIPGAFERIAKDIRSAYTLAYAPTRDANLAAGERKRHEVQVYVRAGQGRAVRVRARDGYVEKGGGGTGQ
jgi:VWFA-related protein